MSWSYSGDPSESSVDAVRFLVGDTHSDEPLVTNEEIEWSLLQYTNIYAAAALVAETIASYFATQANSITIGPLREEYGTRAKDYQERVKSLKSKASEARRLVFYAGGTDQAEKDAALMDTTKVAAIYTKGMDDIDVDSLAERRVK